VPIVLGLLAATAAGQTLTWDGQVDGNWYNPGNWDPNADPADDANRVILSGSPVASADVRVSGGGSITLSGSSASALILSDLMIGHTATGTLAVTGGGTVSNFGWGHIGGELGSHGTVTVDGAGSSWTTNSGQIYVGHHNNPKQTNTGGRNESTAEGRRGG